MKKQEVSGSSHKGKITLLFIVSIPFLTIRTYTHFLLTHIYVIYNPLSMKLSITPAEVSGYSLRATSSLSMNVFGCTKSFRGFRGGFSIKKEQDDERCTNQFLL